MTHPLESIFALGHLATPVEVEQWTGQKFDPRAAGTRLVGARILVIRDKAPDNYVRDPSDPDAPKLYIPETSLDRNPPGSGIVIGVGHHVLQGWATYPGELTFNPNYESPNLRDLLGVRVYFEMYTGIGFRSSLRDSEWKADLLILLPKDILAIDINGSPRYKG